VLGVLALHHEAAGGRPPEGELLEALGKQIGTGLDNARLYTELRASSTRLEFLNRISAALTASMDLKTVVPAFAQEIAELQSFDRLACGFVNESGDYIEVTGHPADATWGLGSVLPVVGSGPGLVVLNNEPILQTDLLHAHRFIEDMRLLEEGIRSYVILPLNARGRSIGVLCLGSAQASAYDENTVAHVQPLADSVALAFENVRLFQKTRELSITDDVTPLYNFRFFHQILDRELKLVERYKSVLSLIFVDLDRFKPINDQWGHLRGSRVLREVGFLLRAAVRETDYPARYGGDEFVVILPQTDGQSARFLGEKLRSMIEEHTFLQEEGINARLGVSLGIATFPMDARSKESLIRLADERMYGDKEARRPLR
jgi:diguanylate cyclase (GGDEF)-like protein